MHSYPSILALAAELRIELVYPLDDEADAFFRSVPLPAGSAQSVSAKWPSRR
jgi:hypothetical protein